MEVILVHGLWFGSWAMSYVARHLRRSGFRVRQFSYRATVSPVAVHAERLARFAATEDASPVSFVGHSLGGLLIMHMLSAWPGRGARRVVLLGSPLEGSRVARKVSGLPGGGLLLGRVAEDLGHGRPTVVGETEIGMIAGSRALGVGRLFGRPAGASDGTVAVEETNAPGLSDRVVLPVSHTGMLFSRAVAIQVATFLHQGRFAAVTVPRDSRLS